MSRSLLRLLLFIALLLPAAVAWAAPTFTLTEHLGESWSQELVSFPVTLPADLSPERLAVKEAAGLTRVAQFVPDAPPSRAGKVYFIVDLPPNAEQTWTLVKGEEKPETDLTISWGEGTVSLGNSKLSITCPWEGDELQAPLVMSLPDGTTTGVASIHSPLNFTSISGETLAQGPVFLQVRLTYTFEEDKYYTCDITVIAGQPVVLVSEQSDLMDKPGFLEGTRPADAPEGNYVMQAYGKRLQEQGSYWTLSLDGLQPDRMAWQPLGNVWGKKSVEGEPWETFPRPTDPGPLVTLNPTHGEWWMNVAQWAGAYSTGGNNFVGLMALSGGAWQQPHENVIVLENDPEGKLQAVLPINGGSRNWALYVGDRDEDITIPGEEPPGETWPGRQYARPIQLATIKYGLLPLDMVKDWALEFPDPPGVVFPHIYATAADLPAIRKRIADSPPLQTHVDRLARVWNSYKAQKDADFPFYKNWVMYHRGLDNLYLATGDETYARDAAELLIARLRYYVHQTHVGIGISGYRWSHNYGMFHLTTGPLPISLRQADILLGSPSVTPEQKRETRALLAFWGELFASRDYAPPGYNHGNTDMIVSLRMVQGQIGSVLSGHPRAKDWAKVCYDGLIWALEEGHHLPNYSQDEWYGSLSLEMVTLGAMTLKRAGFYDMFKDPLLRDGLDFYGQLTVPFDERVNGGYIVPFGNGQGCWTRSVMWADAAAAVAEDDPAFAGRLMWYWNRCGQPGSFRTGDRDDFGWASLGWVDPTLPAQNPKFASEYLPGWGAIFRSGCGLPQETFLALQLAKPAGLAGYNAEGGFQLHAQGQPLCLVFGLRSWDVGVHKGFGNVTHQRWLTNRPSFGYRSEKEGGTGRLLEWSSCSRADLASGEWEFSRLVEHGPLGPPEGPDKLELSKPRPHDDSVEIGFTKEERVAPITWRRHMLFVKDFDPTGPNYFVVRDVADTAVPWDWNLWCLASEEQETLTGARFTGKLGVDLDLAPLTPVPELVTGAYGPEKGFAGDWRQKLYQVRFPAGPGQMAAVLYPRGHDQPAPEIVPWVEGAGAKLTIGDQTHYVVLTDAPGEARADGQILVGRAGVIRVREGMTSLTLLSGTQIGSGEWLVTATGREGQAAAGSLSVTIDAAGALTGESHGAARTVIVQFPAGAQPGKLLIDGKPAELGTDGNRVRFSLPEGDHKFSL